MRGQKVSLRSEYSKSNSEKKYIGNDDQEDEESFDLIAEIKKRNENEEKLKDMWDFVNDLQPKKFRSKTNPHLFNGELIKNEPIVSGWEYPVPSIFKHLGNTSKKVKNREVKEEKYKIKRYSGSKLDIDKSLSSIIFDILKKENKPLHINEIILLLIKNNDVRYGYHTYSSVYKILKKNQGLFIKTDKATFTFRKGFRKWKNKKLDNLDKSSLDINSVAFRDLVIMAARNMDIPRIGSPAELFSYLKGFGFNGTYDVVRKIMQSSPFVRRGWHYVLED